MIDIIHWYLWLLWIKRKLVVNCWLNTDQITTFFSCYNNNRAIGLMSRVFAKCLGDWGSILGRVIPKTQKMVLDAALLYKVRIKGKVEQGCSYWKESLWVVLNYDQILGSHNVCVVRNSTILFPILKTISIRIFINSSCMIVETFGFIFERLFLGVQNPDVFYY